MLAFIIIIMLKSQTQLKMSVWLFTGRLRVILVWRNMTRNYFLKIRPILSALCNVYIIIEIMCQINIMLKSEVIFVVTVLYL